MTASPRANVFVRDAELGAADAVAGPGSAERPLRGRGPELNRLDAALANPELRLLIARGSAGAGKTAFMNEARRRLTQSGALTGAGKHVEGLEGDDLVPLLTALSQAVAAGLDQLYDPDSGLETLASAVGPYGQAFADAPSGLLRGLAERRGGPAMSQEAAEELLGQAVRSVLYWLEGFSQPVVLLIDDWGRAGAQTTRLYRRIVSDPLLVRLRVLATERSEEPSSAGQDVAATYIEMSGLDLPARIAMVQDILGPGSARIARAVVDFLPQHADIPFDVIQATELMLASGALGRAPGWRLDRVKAAEVLGETLAGVLNERLTLLAPQDLRLAQILALFGDTATRTDVLAASGLTSTAFAASLVRLVAAGVTRTLGDDLSLTHDRTRAAVLSEIEPPQRKHLAGHIAGVLLDRGAEADDGGRGMTMLALRLEAGLDTAEAEPWANLFALGARSARAVGDAVSAARFADAALALAERADAVSPVILTEAALAAVQRGDHKAARALADRLAAAATGPQQRDEADELRIFAARMARDMPRALAVGFEAAKRAKIVAPERPSLARLALEVLQVRLADPRRAMRAGPLSDAELASVAPRLRVLMAIGSVLHESNIRQALIFGARSAKGRLGSGTASGASVSAFVCALTGDYVGAARWSEVSDARQAEGQPNRAAAILTTTYFGHWFTRPRSELAGRNDDAEVLAYAEGDLSTAAYANRNRVLDSLFLEGSLAATAKAADAGLRRLTDDSTLPVIAAVRQIAANLTSVGPDPARLHGEFFDASGFQAGPGDSPSRINNVYRPLAMLEAFLAVVCGDYARVADVQSRLESTFAQNAHNPQRPIWIFATGLGRYRTGSTPSRSQRHLLRRLARLNPRDHGHRWLLFEAERARRGGRAPLALDLYEQALAAAKLSDCRLEQGVVARAAAEGAEMLGAATAALGYRIEAQAQWRSLGATVLLDSSQVPEGHALSSDALESEQGGWDIMAARDAAERANRAKSRLLASVGHELRTPLQGIAGLLELAGPTGLRSRDVETLRGAVDQLTTVVGDLTDLGALDTDVLVLSPSAFDPRKLVAGILSMHRATLNEAGRKVVHHATGAAAFVMGDQARIGQIVSNLVGNAAKHGAGDVAVTVNLAPRPGDTVAFSIEVRDEGPGLSPEDLVRIFEPFERGAATDHVAGLGLGLSIARRLAKAMGGELSARSSRAEGAVFRFVVDLPVAARPGRQSKMRLDGRRVLLAEDTALSRRVLAALLRAEGCIVTEAEDGEAAVSLASTQTFDLLVLDMRMPGLDGAEVAAALRRPGSVNATTPIVIVTASRDAALVEAAARSRVQAVLQKPLGREQLRSCLIALETGSWPKGVEPPAPDAAAVRIAEIREVLGAADTRTLLRQLGPNLRAGLSRTQAALATGCRGDAALEAHRLVGLASSFGLDNAAAAARQLELAIEGNRPRRIAEAGAHLAVVIGSIDSVEIENHGA